MGAKYAKLLDPRPYDAAGKFNFPEMAASLGERAAKVVPLLPHDIAMRFQSRIMRYSDWVKLPPDLKQVIIDAEAGRPLSYKTVEQDGGDEE